MNQKQAKADELFFVVDENDQPLEPLPRKLVHGHGVWHRVAHVWIINERGQILCQQRSFEKETNAGKWEPFFGGHLAPDEDYLSGAVREVYEELDFKINPADLKLWKVYKHADPNDSYNNEFQAILITHWDGNISELTFADGEVVQVAWKDLAEVKRQIEQNGKKTWVQVGYEPDLFEHLQSS